MAKREQYFLTPKQYQRVKQGQLKTRIKRTFKPVEPMKNYFSTDKQIAAIKAKRAKVIAKVDMYRHRKNRFEKSFDYIVKRGGFSQLNKNIGKADYRTKLMESFREKPLLRGTKQIGVKYSKADMKKIRKMKKLAKEGKSATFILRRYYKHTDDYKELKAKLGYKPRAFEIIDPERARARDEWYKEHEMELKAASVKYRKGETTYNQYLKETSKARADLCNTYGLCD